MKVRIKFSKQEEMRLIGHLDLQRFFQKAMRRAQIPIRFTEGMSPHMVMSFASPLGVGLTSDGEYVDIETTQPVSTADAVSRLNAVMPSGLRILDWRQVPEGKSENAMALVRAADYRIRILPGMLPPDDTAGHRAAAGNQKAVTEQMITADPKILGKESMNAFLAQEEILLVRENKKAAKKAARRRDHRRGPSGAEANPEDFMTTVDIRPMIHRMEPDAEDRAIFLCCACGSSANLKPEDAVRAYFDFRGISLPTHALAVNRCELYAEALIPLGELGEVIQN